MDDLKVVQHSTAIQDLTGGSGLGNPKTSHQYPLRYLRVLRVPQLDQEVTINNYNLKSLTAIPSYIGFETKA
jgi:hypothetical protein